MEVDHLGVTERGKTGFGSNDISSKRSITANEEEIKIYFLHADTSENKSLAQLISAITLG